MKLISMSVWGNRLIYWEGALANAQLYRSIYPGWQFRIYTDIENGFTRLIEKYGCEVRIMQNFGGSHGAFWRFLPASEEGIEAVVFRDADSRLNQREAAAVAVWLESGKSAHVMRDHPSHHHWPISAGMWGVRGGVLPNLPSEIANWGRWRKKTEDQIFLKSVVWPRIRDDCLQHVHGNSPWGGQPFPAHDPCDSDFVGQIYDLGGQKDIVSAEFRANQQITDQVRNPPVGPDGLRSACMKMLSGQGDEAWTSQFDKIDWALFAFVEEAFHCLREGRPDEATALFRKALDRNPDNPHILGAMAALELNKGDSATALELITRAINLAPRNVWFLTNCGDAFRRLKRFDEALVNYDRALAIAPNDTTVLNARGSVLSDLNRFEEAIASYDRALAIEPRSGRILKNRGFVRRQARRRNLAFALFDRVLLLMRQIMRKCLKLIARS